MEKRTLQLEIHDVWHQWRGNLQDYYDGIETRGPFIGPGLDSMNRMDYKEATAFPMQKPNFDVFGIPGRTRKQRGWYQVQRHPKSRPKQHILFSAPKFSTGVFATGADLPIELVRSAGEIMSQKLWLGHDKKTCALVCRYWASQFMPRILSGLTIRSRQRASGLWELHRSPSLCFHRFCDSRLVVEVNSLSELSFMHLLTQMECRLAGVALTGPLPRKWKTLRSVHQALPRSLPRSFSSGIRLLELSNIHFQRFSDLTHLVCELPDLTSVECNEVTCGPIPDTIATFPRLRRTSSYTDTNFFVYTDSAMGMPAGAHLLAHCITTKESPLLPHAGSVLALASLADGLFNILAPAVPDSNTSRGNVYSNYHQDHILLRWDGPGANLVVRILGSVSRATDVGNIVDWNVGTVTVNLSLSSEGQHLLGNTFNWGKLDEQVSSLGAQLVFACRSRDQMLAFGDEVVDALMPRSSARGSISYAVGQGSSNQKVWYKASRDSDVLQGSPDTLDVIYW